MAALIPNDNFEDRPHPFDRASYRNKGGLIQRAVTRWKARALTSCGAGTVIKYNAEFNITDNGVLRIGENCVIQNYACFLLTKPHPTVEIGNNTVVGRFSMIGAKNSIKIGSGVLIAAFVQIVDTMHGIDPGRPIQQQRAKIGTVEIGDDVWVGAGAKILMNTKVGNGAVIAANAVVTDDVPANAIVGGVPARLIRYRGDAARPMTRTP